MADSTNRDFVEIVVVNGHTIKRINDVIMSAINPAPHMEVREGDVWCQVDPDEDEKAKERDDGGQSGR